MNKYFQFLNILWFFASQNLTFYPWKWFFSASNQVVAVDNPFKIGAFLQFLVERRLITDDWEYTTWSAFKIMIYKKWVKISRPHHPKARRFMHPFIYSFIQPLVHLFSQSFDHPFIPPPFVNWMNFKAKNDIIFSLRFNAVATVFIIFLF